MQVQTLPVAKQALKIKIMKKVTALVLGLFAAVFSVNAASENANHYYGSFNNGQSYIFVEGGVEFSVFPDGQFDFVYVGPNQGSNVNVSINSPNVIISYNSGYNYDAYVQYDDYGAVIQVEEVPIYYDEYGRIVQAGSVEIRYTNRRIVRVGGMHIYYNHYGYYSHYTGFISPWYTTYVYRPWHVYYARPFYSHCIVYDYPYRRYYRPVRYSYHHHRDYYRRGFKNYRNGRREFARVGSRVHYKDGRTVANRDYKPNRENTAARYNKRNDRDGIASNSRPSTYGNTSKGRPVTTNARPKFDKENKGRPTVNRGNPSNARPKYDGNVSREKPKVDSARPSYSGNSSKGRPNSNTTRPKVIKDYGKSRPTVNRGKPSTYSKPKASRTKPTVTSRSTTVKRSTNKSTRSTTSSRKTTTSNSKSTVQKRGRG